MRFRRFAFACLLTLPASQCVTPVEVDFAEETATVSRGAKYNAEIPLENEHLASSDQSRGLPTQPFLRENPTGASNHGGPAGGPGKPDYLAGFSEPEPPFEKWSRDSGALPRYPPPDEWRIKTWWIKKWRPIARKLEFGILQFFSILALPFHLFKTSPKGLRYIPLHRLPHPPNPVWEKLPPGIKKAKGKGIIGIKSNEEELKHSGIPPQSGWKVPELPPLFAPDAELLKQYFLLGESVYQKTKDLSRFKAEFKGRELATDVTTTNLMEKLNDLLNSNENLQLARNFYKKRQGLSYLHIKMQGTLNQVVHDLGGEEKTREIFRKIIQYHDETKASAISQDAKKPKSSAAILRVKYSSRAGEVHLAPLALLHEAIEDKVMGDPAEINLLREHMGDKMYESLTEPAKKVAQYMKLLRQVEQIQGKVMEVRNFVFSLSLADYADWQRRTDTFFDIISLHDVL